MTFIYGTIYTEARLDKRRCLLSHSDGSVPSRATYDSIQGKGKTKRERQREGEVRGVRGKRESQTDR